ncbi:MAG: hypothetical protein ACQCXQ_06100 [Verrucomicrobiales bacterium]|nr:hypothetical protein [Verrucomicrobiota bacterium JB025]
MKRAIFPLVILALIAGFSLWWFSPEQAVKRRVRMLLNTLSLEEGSNKSGRKMGVYSLNAVLCDEVELSSPTLDAANGRFDRQELESVFSWICDLAERSEFELIGFDSVTLDGDSATVEFTVEAVVVMPNYRPADGVYKVDFELEKNDHGWRICRATWTEA